MQKQNASESPKLLTSKKFVEKLKSFGNKNEKLGSDSYLNTNMRDIFSLTKNYMNMF